MDRAPRLLTSALAAACAAPAIADIDLELRPAARTVCAGDVVNVELYAVSDDPDASQFFAALQVVLGWDPTRLQLTGLDDTGAIELLSSGFLFPDPHGLNEADPPQDGDGFYVALGPLGTPVEATPEGSLVTTFVFLALDGAVDSPVQMLESAGDPPAMTVVFDAFVPNLNVTGTLHDAAVSISSSCPGDVNCDAVVDVQDLVEVILAWGVCAAPPETCAEDTTNDGVVDVQDLVVVILSWGPCP